MNAVRSISTGWPFRSYKAITKWKKLLFLKLFGGCFSKCALDRPIILTFFLFKWLLIMFKRNIKMGTKAYRFASCCCWCKREWWWLSSICWCWCNWCCCCCCWWCIQPRNGSSLSIDKVEIEGPLGCISFKAKCEINQIKTKLLKLKANHFFFSILQIKLILFAFFWLLAVFIIAYNNEQIMKAKWDKLKEKIYILKSREFVYFLNFSRNFDFKSKQC